jgi:hypothetical protein
MEGSPSGLSRSSNAEAIARENEHLAKRAIARRHCRTGLRRDEQWEIISLRFAEAYSETSGRSKQDQFFVSHRGAGMPAENSGTEKQPGFSERAGLLCFPPEDAAWLSLTL